jgi:predicted DNA-binding transcriptional regulator AlpA
MAETEIIETQALPELLTLALIRRHFVPLGARTLFRMIATGTFPKADISIGGKTRFWKRATVQAWIKKNAR